jgi:aminopeptidase
VKENFAGIPNVEIIVRDEAWAAEKNMVTFIRTCPLPLLDLIILSERSSFRNTRHHRAREIPRDVCPPLPLPYVILTFTSHYKGAPEKNAQPLAFVGKGITFDSGGISLKPGAVRPSLDSYYFVTQLD